MFNRRTIQLSCWVGWMEQWTELLEAGMPTLDALALSTSLLGQSSAEQRLRISLRQTHSALEAGKTLSFAFEGATLSPPDSLRLAINCGESTGQLSKALRQQITQTKLKLQAQHALSKSLAYPCMVLLMALFCLVFLQQFAQNNGLNQASNTTQQWGDWLLGLGLVFTIGLLLLHRSNKANNRQTVQGAFGKYTGLILPSGLQQVSAFFFVMACQLEAGIDFMHILKQHPTPKRKPKKLDRELLRFKYILAQSLGNGQALHMAMQSAQAPAFLIAQAKIAEQTGRLDTCFFLAAKVFESQAKKRQDQLQAWLGPLTLLTAAGILVYAYQNTLAPLYANLGAF
jgi:type II secretory pathway component PulF